MTSLSGKTLIIFFSLFTIILISGYVIEKNQDRFSPVPVSITSTQGIEIQHSIGRESEIIQMFVSPQKINNLTFIESSNKSGQMLSQYQADNSTFFLNPTTGRVQSAKWRGAGPVIFGITSNLSQSCNSVGEFIKGKYPEIWVSNETRDMHLSSAKKWPLSIETKYECTWFETLYYPDRITNPHYTIGNRNSVDVVIDPSTGMLLSYEETQVPLNSKLSLKPSISEEQARMSAALYFESTGISDVLQSELIFNGLHVSRDKDNNQRLTWSFSLTRIDKIGFDTGGVVGIDAHDGHVVYHATF
jgi:hypothetical protein